MSDQNTPDTAPVADVQGISIPAEYVNAEGQILGRFANVQELLDAVGATDSGVQGSAPATGNTFPNNVPNSAGAAPGLPAVQAASPEGAPAHQGDQTGFQIGAPEAPAATGLTAEYMAKLGQEVMSNSGKLTDESYADLLTKGVTREAADMHIAGQLALGKAHQMQVETALGGRTKIDEAMNWARRNLSAEQITQIDGDLATASPTGQENILRGLMARAGVTGSTIAGANSTPLSAQPFANSAEKDEAFQNPLYESSAAYRADLEKRLKATQTAGYAS